MACFSKKEDNYLFITLTCFVIFDIVTLLVEWSSINRVGVNALWFAMSLVRTVGTVIVWPIVYFFIRKYVIQYLIDKENEQVPGARVRRVI